MEVTTNLPLTIKNTLDEIDATYDQKNEYLQRFQYDITQYLIQSNQRGLLIFHSPGTGKTVLAAAVSEYFRKNEPTRKIIILLPKSLQGNFEKNIKKYMKLNPRANSNEKTEDFIEEALEKKYRFISSNASNMFTQISKIQKTDEAIAYEKYLGSINEYINMGSNFLENTLLIIDECHNLSGAVKNGSRNAVKLYNTIMQTKNIKLLFLTGTPIVNTPFEIVPIFNMLKGYIDKKNTLFPENQMEFYNLFMTGSADSEKGLQIKNKTIFQNRITGLLSYYGDFYFRNQTKKDFPIQLPTKIETVNMSIVQFIQYQHMRDIETKESSYSKANNSENFEFKDPSKTSSSYRIRSRQVSNYCIPDYALEYNAEKTSIKKFVSKIKPEDLDNLEKYSPKFQKILDNIALYPSSLNLVYSEFVSGEGLAIFTLVLERKGYIYWRGNNNGDEFDINLSSSKQKYKTYAIISGEVPFSEREAIIKTFNSKNNINGGIISLILISKSGAEGLSLRNVRSIHIMEPFWNYARIEQIIARGVRFHSHSDLPEKERTVQPYIYISTYPKKSKIDDFEPRTTDEELLHLSISGKKIRDQFEIAMIESSVDCSLNYKNLDKPLQELITCHLCVPNNKSLYSSDIRYDIKHNNFEPFEKKEISANKITFNDKIYYYSENPIKIYEFNKDVGGYTEMPKNDIYSDLLKKILF